MENKSDSPRTDAAMISWGSWNAVSADFARQLERELGEAKRNRADEMTAKFMAVALQQNAESERDKLLLEVERLTAERKQLILRYETNRT